MAQHQFKGISNRGRYLLGIQENNEVDFKESLAGLGSDDLVAFANSDGGGAILIGVREGKDDETGMQTSLIVGCEVGDQAKMSILNRAASCVPRIAVDVFVENLSDRPFLRIEIPEGHARPHCTSSGTYKMREDGQNVGMHPRMLLAMFVEREGERFFHRFQRHTEDLRQEIRQLRETLERENEDKGA